MLEIARILLCQIVFNQGSTQCMRLEVAGFPVKKAAHDSTPLITYGSKASSRSTSASHKDGDVAMLEFTSR